MRSLRQWPRWSNSKKMSWWQCPYKVLCREYHYGIKKVKWIVFDIHLFGILEFVILDSHSLLAQNITQVITTEQTELQLTSPLNRPIQVDWHTFGWSGIRTTCPYLRGPVVKSHPSHLGQHPSVRGAEQSVGGHSDTGLQVTTPLSHT